MFIPLFNCLFYLFIFIFYLFIYYFVYYLFFIYLYFIFIYYLVVIFVYFIYLFINNLFIYRNYDCNGVALWVDWYFCDKLINGGLKKVPAAGDRPDWDWNQRQGVHFLRNISKRANFLNIQTTFFPLRGDISFNFCLE